MSIETQMLITLLKLTKDGPIAQESINKTARMPRATIKDLLQKMQNDHLVYLHDNLVEADCFQRLELAIRALTSGADIEVVSKSLSWREFEAMAAEALSNNGYAVQKNVRFKSLGRRWEIDVVGFRKHLVVCIDCKHWHRTLHESNIRKIVNDQVARVRAFAGAPHSAKVKIDELYLGENRFVPVILSLVVGKSKFYERVPIVPILQLQDFLNYLPASVNSMMGITSSDLNNQYGRQKKLMD